MIWVLAPLLGIATFEEGGAKSIAMMEGRQGLTT